VVGHPPAPDARRHVTAGGVTLRVHGHLISFEGLDQSGKQTQAARLLAALRETTGQAHFLSFPDYETAIGAEIGRALRGDRDYAADVMQLLYIANRYEYRRSIEEWLRAGGSVVCDRYLASSIAYGEAQGLDAEWLRTVQRHLPQPSLTVLLDIPPEASLARKLRDRDRYEQDLELLARVRQSYLRQAARDQWISVDGTQDKDAVTRDVFAAVQSRLGLL
jgi:dTMP kinase